jgi:hypothetical protein
MAADLRFEQQLRGELRSFLGSVDGPHPVWADAPAAASLAEDVVRPTGGARRPSRALVLLAAVVAIALVGAALVAGGAFRPSPGPIPSNPIVLPPATSPSDVAIVAPSATIQPSASPCVTSWSHSGTYPAGGLQDGSFLWDLSGEGGHLYLKFLNSIDTVRQITIAPASPQFHDRTGKVAEIAGTAFFKLTIRGLTRATEIARDDMLADEQLPGFAGIVQHPIAEARRVVKPKQVLGTPTRTEVWLIGVDFPACLSVRTVREADAYEVPQPGDNIMLVTFERQVP